MITRASIDIAAPAERVWEVFTDVAQWPTWTASVSSLEPLDGPPLEVGHRFRIKQPRMPLLVWEVTEVAAPHSWTWVVKSSGATTTATHEITPRGPAACTVAQSIDQRGAFGMMVAVLMRRLTKRYLALEGEGLKKASEQVRPLAT